MDSINKVNAGAGAEWILGAFTLLKRSPLGLGLLGVLFGALVGAIGVLSLKVPTLMLPLQVVMALLGPVLVGGMLWAAREVDHNRDAQPAHLFQAVRDGKVPRLLVTLIPQFAAGLLAMLLMVVIVGPSQLQSTMDIMQQLQGQTQPDPALVSQLPAGKLMLWLVSLIVVAILMGFLTFTAIADMMFTQTGAIAAMKRSFRACTSNLGAMLVFFLLLFITAIGIAFAVNIVGVLVKLVAGETAMVWVSQLLMMAVLMPVVTGAMYLAWKQMVRAPLRDLPLPSVSGQLQA